MKLTGVVVSVSLVAGCVSGTDFAVTEGSIVARDVPDEELVPPNIAVASPGAPCEWIFLIRGETELQAPLELASLQVGRHVRVHHDELILDVCPGRAVARIIEVL